MSFKGGMVNYYHEARAQVKNIKKLTEVNKQRAERRAQLLDPAVRCLAVQQDRQGRGKAWGGMGGSDGVVVWPARVWPSGAVHTCHHQLGHHQGRDTHKDTHTKTHTHTRTHTTARTLTHAHAHTALLGLPYCKAPDPTQQLTVAGTPCKLFRGADAHAANENGDNLVPWNGDATNMIDR